MQETWVRSLIWEDSICRCYAQVAKSPSDHQGADIRCKSKRVFITKLELGLPPLPTQRLRRGAPNFGLHCLYRVFSREKFEKREFPGWETSNWLPSVEGLGVGFWLVLISGAGHGFWLVPISRAQFEFPRQVISPESKVRRSWSGIWLAHRWWGEVRGFPKTMSSEL